MEALLKHVYEYIENIAEQRLEGDIYDSTDIQEAKQLKKAIKDAFPSLFQAQLFLVGKDGDVSRI